MVKKILLLTLLIFYNNFLFADILTLSNCYYKDNHGNGYAKKKWNREDEKKGNTSLYKFYEDPLKIEKLDVWIVLAMEELIYKDSNILKFKNQGYKSVSIYDNHSIFIDKKKKIIVYKKIKSEDYLKVRNKQLDKLIILKKNYEDLWSINDENNINNFNKIFLKKETNLAFKIISESKKNILAEKNNGFFDTKSGINIDLETFEFKFTSNIKNINKKNLGYTGVCKNEK